MNQLPEDIQWKIWKTYYSIHVLEEFQSSSLKKHFRKTVLTEMRLWMDFSQDVEQMNYEEDCGRDMANWYENMYIDYGMLGVNDLRSYLKFMKAMN